MLEEVLSTLLERAGIHPAHLSQQVVGHAWQGIESDDHVAATDVEVVGQLKRYALGAKGFVQFAVEGPNFLDGALEPTGQNHHALADANDAAGDLAAEAAEIMKLGVGGVVGAVDPLHGKSQALEVPIAGDVHGFQMTEQCGTGVPRCLRGGVHNVVAIEGAQRDELYVLDSQARQEALEGFADFVETGFGPADQIHLIDRDH